jgi:hypothetical protein
VQSKNLNINATDVFLAFAVVQQIMTELSGAAAEKAKVNITAESVLRLLKNNANISS